MSSVLLARRKRGAEIPNDMVFVIYGAPGSGKTTLASTFPKTKDKPMLYIDILEGGSGVFPKKDLENTDVVQIEKFEELDGVLEDVYRGYAVDETGAKIKIQYSTIVIDSISNLEGMLKNYLMKSAGKSEMNINLWGKTKSNSETMFNMLKKLHQKTGAIVVGIAHDKEIKDDENPQFNKLIPALMTSASTLLCAKASYVWYTKVTTEQKVDDKTGVVTDKIVFNTYIDAYPYLNTKCRKPKDMSIKPVVTDLTFPKFKKNILDKLR